MNYRPYGQRDRQSAARLSRPPSHAPSDTTPKRQQKTSELQVACRHRSTTQGGHAAGGHLMGSAPRSREQSAETGVERLLTGCWCGTTTDISVSPEGN